MLHADRAELRPPGRAPGRRLRGEVVAAVSKVGGGALPLLELAGPAVALPQTPAAPTRVARALRTGAPAVVGRVETTACCWIPAP
jgi:L-seryl-tRNA(Ser) seleniumtransferase